MPWFLLAFFVPVTALRLLLLFYKTASGQFLRASHLSDKRYASLIERNLPLFRQ